jgi:hypothetical protein
MINDISIWVTVNDIIKYFAILSPNTPLPQINQCIFDAETMDMPSIVDDQLVEDIDTMINSPSLIKPELDEFFKMVVLPYISACTMVRYSPFLGLHATQWGLEQYVQEGFGAVTDKRRAELLNSFEGKKNVFEIKMLKYLSDHKYTFDGVVYKSNVKCGAKKNTLSFSIIGANKRCY